MDQEKTIRELLARHLEGGEAFSTVSDFLEEIKYDKLGERPHGLPYSFYELFYHIRFAQKDILDYCTADSYSNPDWPGDYWPSCQKPDSKEDWESLKNSFFKEREQLVNFVKDPRNMLLKPVKHSDNKTLMREILLVIEHNAYHTAQLVVVLRLLGLH